MGLHATPPTRPQPNASTHDSVTPTGQTCRVPSERNDLDRAPLEQLVADTAQRHRCHTISWGVVRDGELALTGSVGPLDVDADTVYRIASMTKSFSAAATLVLRDEGAFQLDDPIGRLVPTLSSLRGPTSDAAPITIRDLLSMTSGFVTDDAWADRNLELRDDEFDAIVRSGPVFAQPTGTGFEYSNFGYAVLGRVVHRVTGRPLQQHVSERLLEPLGMTRTTWVMPPPDTDWAHPMRWLDGGYVEELPPLGDGLIAPMGGLWTTVGDLAKWISWLDDAFPARDEPDEGPLRRASRREMQTSQQYVGMRTYGEIRYATSYCLGLRELHEPRRRPITTHSGGLPGYGSNMSWRPGAKLGTIALSNATYAPMTELGIRMLELATDQIQPSPPEHPVTAIVSEAAAGLIALLNDWSDPRADRLFSNNVRHDDSWAKRRQEAEAYRPLTISSIQAINDARAKIRCSTGHGTKVTITFSLATNDPTAIQHYEFNQPHE